MLPAAHGFGGHVHRRVMLGEVRAVSLQVFLPPSFPLPSSFPPSLHPPLPPLPLPPSLSFPTPTSLPCSFSSPISSFYQDPSIILPLPQMEHKHLATEEPWPVHLYTDCVHARCAYIHRQDRISPVFLAFTPLYPTPCAQEVRGSTMKGAQTKYDKKLLPFPLQSSRGFDLASHGKAVRRRFRSDKQRGSILLESE